MPESPPARQRGKRGRGRLGDLSDRGMVAYNCGARMFRSGMDWTSGMDVCHESFKVNLTDIEREARDYLLPATWSIMWWRGWNETAQREG